MRRFPSKMEPKDMNCQLSLKCTQNWIYPRDWFYITIWNIEDQDLGPDKWTVAQNLSLPSIKPVNSLPGLWLHVPLFALLARKHSSYQTLNRHLVLTTYSTHFPNGNSSTIPKATPFLVICACLTSPLKVDTITEKRVEYITPKQGQSILSLRKARTTCPALGMLQRPRLMLCCPQACPHSSPTPIAEATWYSAQIQTHSRAKTQILIRNNP